MWPSLIKCMWQWQPAHKRAKVYRNLYLQRGLSIACCYPQTQCAFIPTAKAVFGFRTKNRKPHKLEFLFRFVTAFCHVFFSLCKHLIVTHRELVYFCLFLSISGRHHLLKIKDRKVCLVLSFCIRRHFSNECSDSDSVCVKNVEDANKKYLHLLQSLLNLMQSVNTTMVLLYSCNSEHLPFLFAFLWWISII